MIKELKSFSPCEIMSCSRQHHKMSPDTPRPQRAAPHCGPREREGCPRRAAGPVQVARRGEPGRTGPEQCRRPGEQQCHRRAALDFYRGLGGREGRLQTPGASPRAYGKGPTQGEPAALASQQHLLQTPVSWSRGPTRSARGRGPL